MDSDIYQLRFNITEIAMADRWLPLRSSKKFSDPAYKTFSSTRKLTEIDGQQSNRRKKMTQLRWLHQISNGGRQTPDNIKPQKPITMVTSRSTCG